MQADQELDIASLAEAIVCLLNDDKDGAAALVGATREGEDTEHDATPSA
jgi:hypothetical protein